MKKAISSMLALLLLVGSTIPCVAVEGRASKRFSGYIMALGAEGNGEMVLSYSVLGNYYMDKIGAYSIRIEEEVSTDVWVTSFTVYGDSDPNSFYSYNEVEHNADYTFYGIPDVKYRAVLVAYAEDSTGSEYSREITCSGKVCK